jgi:hypothetical protein
MGLLLVGSTALIFQLQSNMTFIYDDWAFLLYRRGGGAGTYFDPHNQHLVAAPIAIYKLLLSAFGMGSARPFQAVSDLSLLVSGTLLFLYIRRRVGDVLAILGTSLILFYGAAWQDLLWSFQLSLTASVAAGLGALLALDRDDRTGDLLAAALLCISTLFSEVGIAFALGAIVDLALRDRPWVARLYVVAAPLLLYAAWYAGWGHQADTSFSLRNVASSPGYLLDAASQAIAALLGLATPFTGEATELVGLEWGHVILVLIAGLGILRAVRGEPVSRGLWLALAIAAAFWFLAAFNTNLLRPPNGPRLLYPSGVLVILIAAELLRGVQFSPRALLVAVAVTIGAIGSNLAALWDGHENWYSASGAERADLAALQIANNPDFTLNSDVGGVWLWPVSTPSYLSAVQAFGGSVASTEEEVASGTELGKNVTDKTLAAGLGLGLAPVDPSEFQGGRGIEGTSCRNVRISPDAETGILLGVGPVTFLNSGGGQPHVVLARFSFGFPVDLGPLRPHSGSILRIPADLSFRPWRLGLRGQGRVTVCYRPA